MLLMTNTKNSAPRTTKLATIVVGSKYENGVDIATIAKLVRSDIKSAVASKSLPVAKYSVRVSRYSMGQSIDIVVSALDASFVIFNAKRLAFDAANPHASHCGLPLDVLSLYSADYDAMRTTLAAIADAYNRRVVSNEADDGDSASFYLDVIVDSDARIAARERETAAASIATTTCANDTSSAHVDFLTSIGVL